MILSSTTTPIFFAGMENGLLRIFHAGLADPIRARQRQVGAFHFSNWSGLGLGLKITHTHTRTHTQQQGPRDSKYTFLQGGMDVYI